MRSRTALVVIVLGFLLVKSTQESVECGKRKVNHPEKNNWMYTGDVYPGQWPWSAAIYARKDNQTVEYICGGALISRKFVITTRLCVAGEAGALLEADKVLIRLGTHKHNLVNVGKAQHRFVSRIHQPIEYDVASKNGVILLEMRVEVRFNDYVQPVCVSQDFFFILDDWLMIGWGAQKSDQHLGTTMDQLGFCDVLGSRFELNRELCKRDRGIFMNSYKKYEDVWYMHGFINCESVSCKDELFDGLINVADYLTFIIKVTDLDYLQIVREGQPIKAFDLLDPTQKHPKLLPTRNCGHSLTKQISEGPNAKLYEYPWVARLLHFNYESKKLYFRCHGTLISHRYVLTGAHCIRDESPKIVRLGDYNEKHEDPDCDFEDETECSLPVRDYEVEYITVHPGYNGNHVFYDIALVRTTKDVRYEDHIHPVCLPVSQELRQLKLPEYVLTGWNLFKDTSILQKTLLATYNNSMFSNEDVDALEEHPGMFIFTKEPARNYYKMEPLGQYVSNNGMHRFVQFGIMSMNRYYFALNTNVSYFMDWIIANMHE